MTTGPRLRAVRILLEIRPRTEHDERCPAHRPGTPPRECECWVRAKVERDVDALIHGGLFGTVTGTT